MTIPEAAREVQASILGDPPHYLMTAEQLERFVALVTGEEAASQGAMPASQVAMPALPY